MKKLIANFLFLLPILFVASSCVFEDFDEPPVGDLPDLMGNITIAELKALHTLGSDPSLIPGDQPVLEGVVVGNDETGSIFKELYVQDGTGGIVIRLDEVGLNGLYPIGAPVVVDLSGLYIGDFNNKYQITIEGGDRIPAVLVRETVFVNGPTSEVAATTLTLDDLQNPETFDRYLSTLVAFDNLQFTNADAGATFADVAASQDLNRTFVDCDGNTIVTRTSSFADFAGENTPTGNGRVVGLLDVFGTTQQLKLRRLSDLTMTGDRCGSTGGGGTLISIAELRQQYPGTETTVSNNTRIRGVVISDRNTGNIVGPNLFLQDGNAGIVVRFTDNHNFEEGTDLEISVGGLELSEFSGILQVNNVPLSNANSQGTLALPTPRDITVGEFLANVEEYEATLVRIDPATISGGPTFGDGLTVNDGSGSINIFTRFSANFSDDTAPTGEGSVVAIASVFGDNAQLILNGPDDIEADGSTGGGGDCPPDIGSGPDISAGDLRALYACGATSVPAGREIEGVVVSDVSSGNFNNRNIVLQTGETGIVIRFTDPHSFAQNETVRVTIGGEELSEFSNLLQVNEVPLGNATSTGSGEVTPRETTLAEILANGEAWESTVVQVEDLSFDASTFPDGGPINLTDGSTSISAFIRGDASFGGQSTPNGPFTATFVVTQFSNDYQALIRNLGDFE